VGRGNGPKRTYSALIGRLLTPGSRVTEAEVDRLPDPELFRDAFYLYQYGTWTAQTLDECDALLLALVRSFQNTVVKKG
jgi:hypothetical protein